MTIRSVLSLLPPGTGSAPNLATLLSGLDDILCSRAPNEEGGVEVSVEEIIGPQGDIWSLFMTMMLLPEGFATFCGRSPDGELFEDMDFLAEAERREGGGPPNALKPFYKIRTNLLAAEAAGAHAH